MTTTAIESIPQSTVANASLLRGLADKIRGLDDVTDLNEVRARTEAMKAWAKVHGKAKELRLDLLRVEVEALVRIVELGGVDTLPARDRKAAKWLAGLDDEARELFVTQSGGAVTTAAGMCRAAWAQEELEDLRQQHRSAGVQIAHEPTRAATVSDARDQVTPVAAVLANIVDDYTTAGEPFSVDEMAERVISDAALSDADDDDVRRGVGEVCREALRRAPVVKLGNTVLPRFITARTEDGRFFRVPVENALMAHLDDMRAARREQLKQDEAALQQLDSIAERLRAMPGCSDDSRIGQLIASSLLSQAS